ncbi:uncharacterized protein GIQ15_05904 [Arthroderma uncinatum]|uniref:uncharacterized protein n=1 Tax=Arthroderma uncinatum TaxID=74035 RepID=UPI00144ADE54|nr:uncharacterized protein GIQ15_05904 [Arthroderma uncinatum]KAF3480557.1 hypothetical protein GIQ15_05904 [Arthroderma uncinatum]
MATAASQEAPTQTSSSLPRPHEINEEQTKEGQSRARIPIRTYHCSFCNHLLIASTQDLSTLPRRRAPALDNAIILPLPKAKPTGEEEDEEEKEDDSSDEEGDEGKDQREAQISRQMESATLKSGAKKAVSSSSASSSQHYTILLSTTTPDRKPIILRRADGFEKRLLVRCGRCKVVLGYVLDEVHFKKGDDKKAVTETDISGEQSNTTGTGELEVIYILPGALIETSELGKEVQIEKEAWAEWESLAKKAK